MIKLSAEAINPENPSAISTRHMDSLKIYFFTVNKLVVQAGKLIGRKMKAVTGGIDISQG